LLQVSLGEERIVILGGVGVGGRVGVGTSEGDGTTVINICDKALKEEAVQVGKSGGSDIGEGGG